MLITYDTLRSIIRPDSSSEQTSSGKEGESVLQQLEENLPAKIAVTVTTYSLNECADCHETESSITENMGETIQQRLEKTSSTQKANKRLGLEGVESNDTIKIDEPVAMHTRCSTKLQHPSKVKRPRPFEAD
jgi:hypothetical protein